MTALSATQLSRIAARMHAAGAPVRAPLHARLIAGGRSNLTYRIEDDANTWVLRTPPLAGRTPSAHDVGREFRVMRALQQAQFPVPPTVLLEEDEEILGVPFAVTEFVGGHTVRSAEDLDRLDDRQVAAAVDALITTLARLHSIEHTAIGLDRFGRTTAYPERQLQRWASQWALVGHPSQRQLASQLSRSLANICPEQRAVAIVHGDYRIDNTLLKITGPQVDVAAVVDWELSTIGDPVADVATMCAYRHPGLDLVLGQSSAWTSPRLPDEAALAAAYEAASAVRLHHWHFHLGLAYFKLAVIAAGIDHRYRSGATNGEGFDTAADAVPLFLTAGIESLRTAA